jgi:hypothetical protein
MILLESRTTVVLALILVCLLQTGSVRGQDRLGAFVGGSHFVTGDRENPYNVTPNGLAAGLLVPIHLLKSPIFLKLKVVYHGAEYSRYLSQDPYDAYIHASNSLLFGVKSVHGGGLNLKLLVGPGIHNESIYSKWAEGVSAAEVYGEVTILGLTHLKRLQYGGMLSYEHGLTGNANRLVSNRRLQLAFVMLI